MHNLKILSAPTQSDPLANINILSMKTAPSTDRVRLGHVALFWSNGHAMDCCCEALAADSADVDIRSGAVPMPGLPLVLIFISTNAAGLQCVHRLEAHVVSRGLRSVHLSFDDCSKQHLSTILKAA